MNNRHRQTIRNVYDVIIKLENLLMCDFVILLVLFEA